VAQLRQMLRHLFMMDKGRILFVQWFNSSLTRVQYGVLAGPYERSFSPSEYN
jgi:hypothetical protein